MKDPGKMDKSPSYTSHADSDHSSSFWVSRVPSAVFSDDKEMSLKVSAQKSFNLLKKMLEYSCSRNLKLFSECMMKQSSFCT